jgi:hypothetical protein
MTGFEASEETVDFLAFGVEEGLIVKGVGDPSLDPVRVVA